EPGRAREVRGGRGAGGMAPAARGDGLLVPERRADLLRWYEQMLVIRHFEEAAAEQYTRARIGGYLHLNVGEEGTVVGSISALEPQDYIFSNYREHGHAIAQGVDPRRVMAELFGKGTGTAQGRGGRRGN